MRSRFLMTVLCLTLVLTGCSSALSPGEKELPDTWDGSGYVTMGHCLTVRKGENRLNLTDYIDALSADGLYYASWTIGNPTPYENADGDTADLYDARLYFLLGEFHEEEDARSNMEQWIETGEMNYEILESEEITCSSQPYHLITYNCISEDNPYARGVSAFGTCGSNAMCIELTCQEAFDEDLKIILTDFLNNCTYSEN